MATGLISSGMPSIRRTSPSSNAPTQHAPRPSAWAAKRRFWGGNVQKWLAEKGIRVDAVSKAVLAEEAPQAYKDLDEVINAAVGAGIARKAVKMRPIIVWKG